MQSVQPSWNWLLVALSYIISVFGSYVALQLATRIPLAREGAFWGWLLGSAVMLGGGAIWSMHFIGMLAYQLPMQIAYDPVLTVASMLLGIGACAAALWLVSRGKPTMARVIPAGALAGAGVAGMHYTGMAAMQVPGTQMGYIPWLIVLSIVISVVAAIVALKLAFTVDRIRERAVSALVMGIAVCGMHYTGMAAMTLSVTPSSATQIVFDSGLHGRDLAFSVFLATFVVLSVALVIALGDRAPELEA
jgi:NO-binding membrane sensor protein with MHYT domain